MRVFEHNASPPSVVVLVRACKQAECEDGRYGQDAGTRDMQVFGHDASPLAGVVLIQFKIVRFLPCIHDILK
ncbi:hypothetical protein NY78_3860 [Desulfovibrio sp. TomC]|nr:hypothetical protein NY78_3860 [Desulfovibrio sp. TomC]